MGQDRIDLHMKILDSVAIISNINKDSVTNYDTDNEVTFMASMGVDVFTTCSSLSEELSESESAISY